MLRDIVGNASENMVQRRVGSSLWDGAVIGQSTWYIDEADRAAAFWRS